MANKKFWLGMLAVSLIFVLTFAGCGDGAKGGGNNEDNTLPALTGTVVIDNTSPKVGDILTAAYSGGNGTGTATYQWIQGESTNIGTNSNTYTVTASNVGKTIKVKVIFADQSGSITSAVTGIVAVDERPALTGTVAIDNTSPKVGDILTAAYSGGNGTGTATWQWIQGESTNIGTNSNTYTVVATDEGKTIKVRVSFANQSGSKTSDATGITVTAPSLPALTGTPSIIGTVYEDDIITANTTGLNGTGTYSYEWKRGDTATAVNTAITGANQRTYTLTNADVGKYITVTVTNSGNSGSVTSEAAGPVTVAPAEITVPGADLAAKLSWLKTNAQSNRTYLVTVEQDEQLGAAGSYGNNSLSYSSKTNITIRLEGTGAEKTITLSSNGSLFDIKSGVTLILDNNITLQGKSSNNAPVVNISSNGVLVMKEGAKITGNATSRSGGGVYIQGGTFTMDGGEISGNTISGTYVGGGVYVGVDSGYGTDINGTFTMNGGKITNNTVSSSNGGGVYVSATQMANGTAIGIFTMTGGEISNNNAANGGGVYMSGTINTALGTFTMSGGEIFGNTTSSSGKGGGVYISDKGTFTLSSNGKIYNNGADSGGGVYVNATSGSPGTFKMTGGEISNNTSSSTSSSGAGVFVIGTFTMSSGKISGNTASGSGGGVYMAGTFTMSGGEISKNTVSGGSNANGGGVFVYLSSNSTSFTKTGGTITGYGNDTTNGNVVKNTSGAVQSNHGHAVYVDSSPAKRRESTAGSTVNLNSSTSGSGGGWE